MKVLDRVTRLCQNKELRDSDKKLLLAVWQEEGLFLSESQRQIFLNKCSVAESITRARRDVVRELPASKTVTEQRFKEFEKYRGGNWRG